MVVALGSEFLLGTAIGIAASLVYDAAYAGGRAVDDYTGVKAIAPSAQLVAPSGFGRIWSLAFTGAYFLLGVYRFTLPAFAHSFARIPPGAAFDASAWGAYALSLASTVFAVGVAVAAPAIALSFVVHVAIGALSRAIPRFGSFTLVFPPAFGAALIATALAAAGGDAACRASAPRLPRIAMSEAAEKPFDATPQRLERARREGNVARAGELAANCSFAASALALVAALPLLQWCARSAIERAARGAVPVAESRRHVGLLPRVSGRAAPPLRSQRMRFKVPASISRRYRSKASGSIRSRDVSGCSRAIH